MSDIKKTIKQPFFVSFFIIALVITVFFFWKPAALFLVPGILLIYLKDDALDAVSLPAVIIGFSEFAEFWNSSARNSPVKN